MNVSFVLPQKGLIAAVVENLAPAGKDYSRQWVVFPERRPAYYLRKALADRLGTGFIPPLIDSIDAFVDKTWMERLSRPGRPIDVLDAVALLFEIHRDAPGKLGGGHFLTADQFFPLGTKLFRDLEDLAAAAVDEPSLIRADGWSEESIPEKTRERLQSLSFFSKAFYDLLETRGFSTPGSRLRAVAKGIERGHFEDIDRFIFAGFFSLTGAEATLLRKMLAWPDFLLLLLQGKGLREILGRLGIPELAPPAAAPPEAEPAASIDFVKSPDTHGQVFALNAALAPSLADRSLLNERSVIVLPAAETLFPLYQQTLSTLAQEEYNISLGYPLSRTPIYSFFDRLLDLIQSADERGRVFSPHYLRFVLHPYTKNIVFGREKRADLTRLLFHAVEEELTARRTRVFWTLEEIENDAGLRRTVQERARNAEGAPEAARLLEHLAAIHATLISPFRVLRDVADFAAKLAAALEFVDEHGTARRHVFFHPYAEAFLARLGALRRSLLGGTAFEAKTGYFNLFRKVIAAGTVPFEGTPLRGLQVLGFWETRGLPFEDVTILDMNEDVLPASKKADSLLPLAARRALGLPTSQDVELRIAYYLDTLLRGARRVRLFFIENKDKEPSRFVGKLLWERQKRERKKSADAFVRTVRYQVSLQSEPPEAVAKTPAVLEFLGRHVYSATALDTYLQCPLRFYHAYVLGLREKEEVGEGMERKDIGAFVHSILEEYFGRHVGKRLRRDDLDPAAMEALVERRFTESFGSDLSGSLYLLRLQTARHLRDFLTAYQVPTVEALEAEGKGLTILALEKKMETALVLPILDGGASVKGRPGRETRDGETRRFSLTARIDRVELRGGDLHILDYKTSASTKYLGVDFPKFDLADRSSWAARAKSIQLPLYNLILSRTPFDPILGDAPAGVLPLVFPPDRIHCAFLMIGRNTMSPRLEFPAEGNDKIMRDFDKILADAGASAAEKEAARSGRAAETGRRMTLMHDFIARLLLEIVDPAVPFDPALQREDACGPGSGRKGVRSPCPYAVICGRQGSPPRSNSIS